ncbi:MAG: peptidylprolyl isomerase [Pseudomonadota bacterium]
MARICILLLALLAVSPILPATASTTIVAVVDGKPITNYDVAQRERLLRLTGSKGNRREQALQELIDEKLQLDAARKAKLKISDAEVDRAVGDIAKRVRMSSTKQLAGALRSQGVDIRTLKDRIRAQIAFNRLVRARFQASLQVTEQDLVAALLKNEDLEKQIDAAVYQLEQVTIALPDNPSDSRLRQARARANDLRSRFTSCSQGVAMARKTRNVVVKPFGTRMETDLTPDVRKALEETNVGRLSAPIQAPRGLVMFAVCDKKTVRSSNAAMKALEPEMTSAKGEAYTKQYLRTLRRDAVIERR